MAKIARKNMKIFGSSAGLNQISEYGSLAASAPAYTTDPETIQALSNYLTGWFGAVIGSNSPAIEDMNALCYLYAYQLSYLFQAGVAEWNSLTTYYIGSMVNSAGQIYVSLTDTNLNHAVSDTTNWQSFTIGKTITSFNPAVSSPKTVSLTVDFGRTFNVNTANGASQFNLPVPTLGFWFTVKDSAGSANTFGITFHRNAAESIEGLAADYTSNAAFGETTIYSDGTNWFLGN